jgi:hypothetical protein
MMASQANCVAIVLLALSFACGCARPPAENESDSQRLPFDRQPGSTGISPSRALIPSTTKLPEGTPIPVRLDRALSSTSSHAGDTFRAIVDEPVVIDGQTLIASGAPATGRVLEARASTSSLGRRPEPGYLRVVLVSLKVGGRQVMIETSSIFGKVSLREERNQDGEDIVFSMDRRLNFRLAQTVDLQQP